MPRAVLRSVAIAVKDGFRLAAMDGEASVWERDLATLKPLGYPEWIRVETPEWAAESGLEASKKESLHS
jgi:hypothetical protein